MLELKEQALMMESYKLNNDRLLTFCVVDMTFMLS
jgi:hypothetical protein